MAEKDPSYIHTYHAKEQDRLERQADFLQAMIYERLDLSKSRKLLEIGCGTGAQTKILLESYPELSIHAVDISKKQIEEAQRNFENLSEINQRVDFLHVPDGDLTVLVEDFDVVFICFVLEHSKDPLALLRQAYRHLKPGGQVILTEVNNTSLQIRPTKQAILQYWDAFNDYQRSLGGDPDVGLRVGQLLTTAGFDQVHTHFMGQHHDNRNPENKMLMFEYFCELMLSAKEGLLESNRISEELVNDLVQSFDELKNVEESIFHYTGVQGWGFKPDPK
ncbi:MAG: methyltransferase [Saprospiraceae bacterium]|nr:methyltransferase [Saprospiraceae bacterium]